MLGNAFATSSWLPRHVSRNYEITSQLIYFINWLVSIPPARISKAWNLNVQSCKIYNHKYMITSIQITNPEIFAFISVLIFKLLNHKVFFSNRKSNRNWGYFFRKWHISRANYCKLINSWNALVSGCFWNTLAVIYQCFFNLHDCTFNT